MDPLLFREYEAKLADWLAQDYKLLADDVDGGLRVTVLYVSHEGGIGSERFQEYWPMTPEIVTLLEENDIGIAKALAGPRPWVGPHPEDQ
jgi:hypothetical protein